MTSVQNSPRVFAIVPAAGESRRMGRAKLLLPWQGRTVLDGVLRAWKDSDVDQVVVVTRDSDRPLQDICRRWPVELVSRTPNPRDMKESIQYALQHVMATHSPLDTDRWMVAPADLPKLTAKLINEIVAAGRKCHCVVVPRFGDRPGHPVLLPWRLADGVFQLAADEGIDRLLARQEIVYVDFPAASRLEDIDTPEDYRRLK